VELRAVFFDFGGTLFSYSTLRERYQTLIEDAARRRGVQAAPQDLHQAWRRSSERVMREWAQRPFYLHRELFREVHAAFLRELGVRPEPGEGDVFYEGQTALGQAWIEPRPDAASTLARLRRGGLRLAVVSNIDDDQFERLWARIGLDEHFEAVTTSEQARSCKPNARIFEVALGKLPGLRPEQVAFVGDSLEHDVAGACAFGMRSVWIGRAGPQHTSRPRPHHVIERLSELPEALGA
jgi:2-haloalkanoic acid dehalogenase type II